MSPGYEPDPRRSYLASEQFGSLFKDGARFVGWLIPQFPNGDLVFLHSVLRCWRPPYCDLPDARTREKQDAAHGDAETSVAERLRLQSSLSSRYGNPEDVIGGHADAGQVGTAPSWNRSDGLR
jgi:hypothetical protein